MKQYLVTGGAGFIGSHIVEALLKRGDSVRVLDNFATSKRDNIPAGAELFEASITETDAIAPAFQGVDGVFHTAALTSVEFSLKNPIATSEVNLKGMLNVILAARHAGVAKMLFSS